MNKRNFIKTSILGSFGALVPVGLLASNQKAANGVILRPHQQEVFDIFKNTDKDIFCIWGAGEGKTFVLNYLCPGFLEYRPDRNPIVMASCPNYIFLDDCFQTVGITKDLSPEKKRKIFFGTPETRYEENTNKILDLMSQSNNLYINMKGCMIWNGKLTNKTN